MSDELRQLLSDTAPEPTRPLDAAGVVRRARRQTVGLRVAAGAASLVMVVVAVVGLPRLWDDTAPHIADTPPQELATAPIGVLDTPAGPDDELPRWVAEELQIDPDAAATARLARRTPGRTFYLYADDTPTGPQALPGPAVCVAVIHDAGLETAQACGPRQVPSRRHTPVAMMSDVGTVGIAPDGITWAREVADSGQLPDVPVVNNLFIDPAPPGTVALEGRSDDAFCAVAPMRGSDPQSLADSDDPMGLLEQMATTAPADIADDMYLVWDYLRLNPDAIQTDTVAFADHVQQAANRVDEHIRSACRGESSPSPDATEAVSPADREVVARFLDLAANPSPSTAHSTPFAEEVTLGLGPALHRTVDAQALGNPDSWRLPADGFRGRSGQLSALEAIDPDAEPVITVGHYPHCASPPRQAPEEFSDHRRLSVHPDLDTLDSCLQWWTVDLYLDPDGQAITAVSLDLWDP